MVRHEAAMTEPHQIAERSYQTVNRLVWTQLAQQGDDSAEAGQNQFAQARQWLDPQGWMHWPEIRRVLCLASGGGRQAPMFACLGCHVVSADLCPEQLRLDSESAHRHGFEIECIEADMLDLSMLYGRDFDLVYQAISACYVPDVRRLYAEVFRVLRPGGYYRAEHWNPVNMQLADDFRWTGRGYEMVRTPGSAHAWHGAAQNGGEPMEAWHYIHSLTDQIGGLCDAGFRILHFSEHGERDESAEPGSKAHAYIYAPPFLSLYAQCHP
jgi:SAM-dependent methyltransferase